jgi:hypothetical protein
MKWSELHTRIKSLPKVESLLKQVVQDFDTEITDLNKEQLRRGKKKDGSSLGTYRPFTIQERLKKGLQVSFVDLKFTGAFQDSMKVVLKGNSFDFTSTDFKTDMLQDRYGEIIFGLTPENKVRFMREHGNGALVQKISNVTGIGKI